MKIIILTMAIALLAIAVAHGVAGPETSAISNYHSTVIAGKYFPVNGDLTLIPPAGTDVTIQCRDASTFAVKKTTTAFTDVNGYFSTVLDAAECTVGDDIKACLDNPVTGKTDECNDWDEVKPTGAPGWGVGIVNIFGVPEYTTLGAGLLVLLTGGSIAYLRKRKY